MATLTYRTSISATVPGSTTAKGTPLTNLEMDGNFKSINDDIQTRATAIALANVAAAAADSAVAMSIALG